MEKSRVSSISTSASSSSSIDEFSSSSTDSHGVDKSSKKRRHQRRKRSRKNSSGSRRSADKLELARKHSKDGHSRSKKVRVTKKRERHRSDSEELAIADEGRSRKRPRKRKAEKVIEVLKGPFDSESNKEVSNKSKDCDNDTHLQKGSNSSLQIKMDVREQQKAMIRRNAEIAKARLASGELQRARDEQIKMHQLYGTVDWRAKKKLRTEKRILERTVAAGKKLASLEEREHARMDAFRVALGLPTAEAQRQAEWRAEATQALTEMETLSKHAATARNGSRGSKHGLIGPTLPP